MDEVEQFQYIEDMTLLLEFIFAHYIAENNSSQFSLVTIR